MPNSSKTLTEDIRAPFLKSYGYASSASTAGVVDNTYKRRSKNAAGTGEVDVWSVDAENNLMIGGAPFRGTWQPIPFKAVANGNIVTTRFHVFGVSGRIMRITEIHNTAGNHASAVTLNVTKEISGQAPGAGTSVMSSTFDLKGTANTEQTATLNTTDLNSSGTPIVQFAANEMLSLKLTGNAQTAAGVLVMVWVQYDLPVFETSWYSAAVTSQDQRYFVANRPFPIRSLQYVHAVAETTDATSNVMPKIQDGTETASQGTGLITNDSSAGFDLNAVANVPQAGVLAAAVTMVADERLSVDFNSSNTEGAGVVVTTTLNIEEFDRIELTFWLHDTDVTDAWFASLDRSYNLYDGRFIFGVAAGGTATLNIEKASGTTNASGGTDLLATAIDLNATADTIQVADIVTLRALFLLASANRMSVDYDHTEQSLVGLCFTLSLIVRH